MGRHQHNSYDGLSWLAAWAPEDLIPGAELQVRV